MVSLEFFSDIIFLIALWPWGRLSLQQKWVLGGFPGGKCGRCIRLKNLPPSSAVVMKSGNLNFLEPSGPLQACNGTDVNFFFTVLYYTLLNYSMLHNVMFQTLMSFKNQQQLFDFKLVFILFCVEPVCLQKHCTNFDLHYLTRTAKFISQLHVPTFSYIRPNYRNTNGTKCF